MLSNCGVGEDSLESLGLPNVWSVLKEINPEYSCKGLMLKLKLQYFDHLMQSRLTRKDPDAGKDWRQEEKGTTEEAMVGWHHQLNGHEFEQTPGDDERQGNLACWVQGIAKSQTQLSDWTTTTTLKILAKWENLVTQKNTYWKISGRCRSLETETSLELA